MDHTSDHPADPTAVNPGYETRDVNIRAVLWLAAGVAAATMLAAALLWWLLTDFTHRADRRDPPTRRGLPNHPGPSGPRLQDTPLADFREFRAREDRVLSTYGWVDQEKLTVRIPINRAMELLVERGETAVTDAAASEETKEQ